MIEMTEQQANAVAASGATPPVIVDPNTKTPYVLVRKDLYDQLTDYDDSPWTDEEMDHLGAEVDRMLDDDMATEESAP